MRRPHHCCELWFGRLVALRALCYKLHWWSKDKYKVLFIVCAALKNYHVSRHPLQDVNADAFSSMQMEIYVDGHPQVEKKWNAQQRYSETWKRKLARYHNRSAQLFVFEDPATLFNFSDDFFIDSFRSSDGSATDDAAFCNKAIIDVSRTAETHSYIV